MSEPREMTPEEWAEASLCSLNDIVTFTKLNGSSYQLRGRTTPEGWPFAVIVSVASPGNEPALELVRKLHDDLVRLGAPLRGYAQNPNEADPYNEAALKDRIQELESTCAAQREALNWIALMRHNNAEPAEDIVDGVVNKALSTLERATAGRDYRDAVLEEAAEIAEHYGPNRPPPPGKQYQDRHLGECAASSNIARQLRALKRGGK